MSCAMASPEIYFHDPKTLSGVAGTDSLALARRRQLVSALCWRMVLTKCFRNVSSAIERMECVFNVLVRTATCRFMYGEFE